MVLLRQLLVATLFMCATVAKADRVEILMDTSASMLDSKRKPLALSAIQSVVATHITVRTWNSFPAQLLSGDPKTVSSRIEFHSKGVTNLAAALRKYQESSCYHLLVIVHGVASDIERMEEVLDNVLERNRVTLIVIPQVQYNFGYDSTATYRAFSHENYTVRSYSETAVKIAYDQALHAEPLCSAPAA